MYHARRRWHGISWSHGWKLKDRTRSLLDSRTCIRLAMTWSISRLTRLRLSFLLVRVKPRPGGLECPRRSRKRRNFRVYFQGKRVMQVVDGGTQGRRLGFLWEHAERASIQVLLAALKKKRASVESLEMRSQSFLSFAGPRCPPPRP